MPSGLDFGSFFWELLFVGVVVALFFENGIPSFSYTQWRIHSFLPLPPLLPLRQQAFFVGLLLRRTIRLGCFAFQFAGQRFRGRHDRDGQLRADRVHDRCTGRDGVAVSQFGRAGQRAAADGHGAQHELADLRTRDVCAARICTGWLVTNRSADCWRQWKSDRV